MRQSRHPQIRELLRKHPDGLTAPEIADALGITNKDIFATVRNMPDTYIDRWRRPLRGKTGRISAVWCVVTPPDDCPQPPPRRPSGKSPRT